MASIRLLTAMRPLEDLQTQSSLFVCLFSVRGGVGACGDEEGEETCIKRKLDLRLAGKKFGHPAGMEKIKLKIVKRNEPKTLKILIENFGNREIAAK